MKATIVLHSGQVMTAPCNAAQQLLRHNAFFVGSRVKRVRKLFLQTATALYFGELKLYL